ncbi:hypothetical protein K458DRAFT_319660 [Lentithecium fluviatile CBS 122367]|uniref:BYS1 domain protein n=1 Tax=Lentithecium fluviatile CBS 122367 TaxID=1168545 RepID=A0A6G1IH86_9PLEO|nr:hypothetical protein K458DRAFT_319660 [Lentithecium fluviatile CBS 122367]
MKYPLLLLSLIAGAHAVGRAIVTNQCDDPVYLWSVGSDISPQVVLEKDQSYSEVFHHDPKTGGIAIKIAPVENGIFLPNVSQTIFAYNLDGNTIWYDMSDIFGDGFTGRRMTVAPTDAACESIIWWGGKPPGGSQVKNCQAETDLELTFCTGHCLPSWSLCGDMAPGETRFCCTHCIGSHHCVAAQ